MMKKLKVTKRSSAILISMSFVSLCVIGIIIQQSVSSSRVVLKDELKIERKLLHNGEGEHACHCFSPFITNFVISDITGNGVSISWDCDAQSTYQVNWGLTSTKGNYFPKEVPTAFYTKYTIVLTGLEPETEYHVGPSGICDYYGGGCDNLTKPNLRKECDTNNKKDWTFKTLATTTYTISGAILNAENAGISEVTVTLSGDKDAKFTTGSDGIYMFADLLPGNYTITPTKVEFDFEPSVTTYSSLNGNQESEDFEGSSGTGILVGNNVVTEARVTEVTAKEVTIRWKTNIPLTSLVEYGLTTAYGSKSGENTILARDHVIQLFDFQFGGTYHARAVSKDPSTGEAIYSSDFTFKTPTSEDRIANLTTVYNEPNPCFERTMFVYYLYQPIKRLTIDIFSLSGKTVATLEAPQSTLMEGYNKLLWDVRDNTQKRLPTGLYVYRMKFYTANNQVEVKKSNLMVRK